MASDDSSFDHIRLREVLSESETFLVRGLGPPSNKIEEFYHDIPVSINTHLKAKIWRPSSPPPSTGRPLILLFHGGGFFAGSCEMLTRPGREFAEEFDAVVVSSDYRLAPEHKLPQAMLDGLDVLEWLISNAEDKLGANPSSGLIVGGYSAGGQLATVVASEARTREFKYKTTGCFICIPSIFTENIVPAQYKYVWTSREVNSDPFMTKEFIEDVWPSLQGADTKSAMYSPVNHMMGLRGMPPTYVQVGGKDVFRDDGIVYAKMLQDDRVPTKIDEYPELGHQAWTIWTDHYGPYKKELENNTFAAMRWLLKM